MRIDRLILSDFRSYSKLDLTIATAKNIILTGENGAGKTNVLEAISMLSPTGPLRKTGTKELGKIDGENHKPWTVFAHANGHEIGVANTGENTKSIRVNGAASDMVGLVESIRVIWITPLQDRLFSENSSERRRFLDSLIGNFNPWYSDLLADYNSALKQRAKVLKSPAPDTAWLDSIEAELASLNVSIAASRIDFIAKINKIMAARQTDFPNIRINIEGFAENLLAYKKSAPAEEEIKAELRHNRGAFKYQSQPAVEGAHRSDFSATNVDKDIDCSQTSTGEQKLATISIVLAYAEMNRLENGDYPVILLDEAAAHLDTKRRAQLFAAIEKLPTQIWLTGANKGDFDGLPGENSLYISIANSSPT
ncbi:MAG: DNA replication and repair protein RecF [Alphaproteobacteria bacterium]|nr:DNA replication and repair protein RecF [Alphaproteobacteria bacterium]